jgi:hypothetical protein
MAIQIMMVLEGHIAADQWAALTDGFAQIASQRPAELLASYLVPSATDPTLWRRVGVWSGQQAFDAFRASVQTPPPSSPIPICPTSGSPPSAPATPSPAASSSATGAASSATTTTTSAGVTTRAPAVSPASSPAANVLPRRAVGLLQQRLQARRSRRRSRDPGRERGFAGRLHRGGRWRRPLPAHGRPPLRPPHGCDG